MNIQPDTAVLDAALDKIALKSQYVIHPADYRAKRKLLADIREIANEALLAFEPIEHAAVMAAAAREVESATSSTFTRPRTRR